MFSSLKNSNFVIYTWFVKKVIKLIFYLSKFLFSSNIDVINTFKCHVFAPMGRFQLELIYLYFPPSLLTPTRPVENVVITTKGLQDRNNLLLDWRTVENKGKLINVIPFKIVPMGNYTPMETFFHFCWQRRKSSTGMVFSMPVTLFWMFSKVPKWRP